MKKPLTLLIVLVLAASFLCIFSPQINAYEFGLTEDLQVTSYTYYISENTEAFVIVGEVTNVGDLYIHSARIRAVVYNSSDVQLAEPAASITYTDQIAPGESAPFYMYFTYLTSVTNDLSWASDGSVDHIEFFCFAGGDEIDSGSELIIGAHTPLLSQDGNYSVTGVAINRGALFPDKYYVVGTFYDAQGKVVAIGMSDYLTKYIGENEHTTFTCGLYDAPSGIGNQIANYSLRIVVESVVDEIPVSTSSPSASASTSPTATATSSAAPTSTPDTESSNTLYIAIAVIGIVIAIVVLVILLKRR